MHRPITLIVAVIAALITIIPAAPTSAAPSPTRYPTCTTHYVFSGSLERAESRCGGLPAGQLQRAEIEYVTGINQYVWTFGAWVGNGATSYTLFKPNVVAGGVQFGP